MSQQLEFTDTEWASLKAEFCKGFTDEQAEVCRTFCRVRNLIPGKHIIFQLRQSKEWDAAVGAKVSTIKIIFMTTIDAARLIALRSGEYTGQDQEVYIYLDANGAPSIESTIPLPQLPLVPGQTALPREPWAVRTTVYRKSFTHPITSVARFDAYASTYTTANGPQLTEMWSRRAPEMLAKCSEMLSLRKSFPEELSNLYISDEIRNEIEEEKQTNVAPASVIPLPPPVPKVDQTPAQPVEAPRPSEKTKEARKEVVKVLDQIETAVTDIIQTTQTANVPPVNPELEKALAALPPGTVKPAAELPPPVKKRGGRPKKSAESPDNGPQAGTDQGITQADVDNVETKAPPPEIDQAASKQAAEEFVSSLDPTPTKEEQAGFSSRVRALAAAGANTQDLRNYILAVGHKDEPKQLTVANWNDALTRLETALGEGKDKLVEATKNAPLPAF